MRRDGRRRRGRGRLSLLGIGKWDGCEHPNAGEYTRPLTLPSPPLYWGAKGKRRGASPTLLFLRGLCGCGAVLAFEDLVDRGLEGVHGAGFDLRLVDGAFDVNLEELPLGPLDEISQHRDFWPIWIVGGEVEGHL